MTINLNVPDISELKPRITVFGVGGAGGNAVNNMITAGLQGVDFVVANTDAQALTMSKAQRIVQMGTQVTQGLGAGSQPDVGAAAAQEVIDEIRDHLTGANMVFVTAGMGGGTGTGAAPVIAKTARDMGILTVGVITKPFHFEGQRRMRTAEAGIAELHKVVDTLLIIPNQNLFRVANEKTTFADAFAMADQVLYSGVACITDLMVKEGLINLDFADVRAIMRGMGKAMMGTGEASGEKRANRAAEAAIANPLLDDVSMKGARGLLISITGGSDLTLYELDEAATRIREEVDQDANIILGATFDESLDGIIRVSVVATGIEPALISANSPNNPAIAETEQRIAEVAERLRAEARSRAASPVPSIRTESVAPAPSSAPAPAPLSAPEMRPESRMETRIEAAAPVTRDDVVLAPVQARAAAPFVPAPAPQRVEAAPAVEAGPFVPPRPAAPTGTPLARAPRMPQIHELPPIAQTQIMANRAAEETAPESKRTSLLRRLATVGFGGRREDMDGAPAARPASAVAPQPHMGQPHMGQPHMAQPHMAQPHVPPAPRAPAAPAVPQYRPAQGNLDAQGRVAPQPRMMDDDQLEIPAFLRRQAN